MLNSFRLISHPEGEGRPGPKHLKDHLFEVGSISKEVADGLSMGDFPLTRDRISTIAYLIGVCHDFGKATSFFQQYITHPDNPNRTQKRFHSQISSLFGYYVVDKITGDRDLAYIAYYVIYYHHGDMADLLKNEERLENEYLELVKEQASDMSTNSAEELHAIYDSLLGPGKVDIDYFLTHVAADLYSKVFENIDAFVDGKRKSTDNYFTFLLFYSILLYSDKLSASGIDHGNINRERQAWSSIPASVIDGYVSGLPPKVALNGNRLSEINILRNEVYEKVIESMRLLDIKSDRFLLIKLPTGMGKTMISVASALRLRERVEKVFGFRPRIIYSLPFLSIIDDNFDKISDALSPLASGGEIPTSLLLKHHHLAEIYFSFSGNKNQSDTESYGVKDIQRRFLLMEGWNSEFVVTSFVQLFHSLITNRNSSAMKFANIANSIIILDEVQALRHEYLPLVREVLKFLTEKLNSWVIFMTATMPVFLDEEEATNLVPEQEKYFDKMDRAEYTRIEDTLSLDDLAGEVLKTKEKSVMVVVNTIESSRQLYELLKLTLVKEKGEPDTEKGYADFADMNLIYLSSAVTPHQRKERIKLIKESGKRSIVVSTQLVEAGVDIDFDMVIRDMAPLDSIVQAGGRVNRNNLRTMGEVRLVRLVDERGDEYARRIYDPVLLDITKRKLDNIFKDRDRVTEAEMHECVNSYYEEVRNTKSDIKSKRYLEYLETLMFDEIHKFNLIENTYQKADVFVPIDAEAKKVWENYVAIRKTPDPMERYGKMLGIRNRFYDYVVSVRKELVGNVEEPVVNADEFSVRWNLETGVKGLDLIW